jgi:hypothetical protein
MVPELSDAMRTKDNNEVKAVRLERGRLYLPFLT